jgi:hypothetical protein
LVVQRLAKKTTSCLPSTQADSPSCPRTGLDESLSRNPTRLSPIARPSASPRRGFRTVGFERRSNDEQQQSTDQVTSEFLRLSSIDVASTPDWNTWSPAPPAERNARRPRTRPIQRVATDSSRSPSPASGGGVHTSVGQGRVRPTSTSSSSGNTPSTSGKNSTTVRGSATFEPEVPHSASAGSSATIGKAQPRRPAPPRKTATSDTSLTSGGSSSTSAGRSSTSPSRGGPHSPQPSKRQPNTSGHPIEGLDFYLLCFKVTEHYLKCEDYNVFQDTPLISRRIDIRFNSAARVTTISRPERVNQRSWRHHHGIEPLYETFAHIDASHTSHASASTDALVGTFLSSA